VRLIGQRERVGRARKGQPGDESVESGQRGQESGALAEEFAAAGIRASLQSHLSRAIFRAHAKSPANSPPFFAPKKFYACEVGASRNFLLNGLFDKDVDGM